MVVLIIRKYNPKREYVGLSRAAPAHKGNLPLPYWITNMNEFGQWLQSNWGEGRYYISLSARRYGGFRTVFNGFVKNNKAIGSGKIHYYLSKNKERQANQLKSIH